MEETKLSDEHAILWLAVKSKRACMQLPQVSRIAQTLGINRKRVRKLLLQLEEKGFLKEDSPNRRAAYSITEKGEAKIAEMEEL